MKITTLRSQLSPFQLTRWLLCLAAFLFVGSSAHAGLTLELHLLRFSHGQAYRFFTPLTTNSAVPAASQGTYFISSPFYSPTQTTNGSWRAIVVDTNGANTVDGTENVYFSFDSFMNQITNGPWTMVFTNNTTTNVYHFTVSAPTAISNMLPATIITFPADDSINVTNQPTLTWQPLPGFPASTTNTYVADYDFSVYEPVILPPGQNSWTIPSPIPDGENCFFTLNYITNDTTPVFVISTPVDTNSSLSLSGWSSFDTLETGDTIGFAVTNQPAASTTLLAHYTFDDGGNLGRDSSGNGYDLDFDAGNGVLSTNDAWVGSGAAYFDGGSFFSYTTPPTNILHALAGSFSVSFWIKTTQDNGNEDGPAWAGAGIVAADVPGGRYDVVPAALDGGQIGFNTGPFDDTLNSSTNINAPGSGYHHVVVTRDQTTGEKRIYIDGILNQSDFATLNPLSDPRLLAIGCGIDASQSDPNNANPGQFFQGELDDLQIYSGVLSPAQVTQLYRGTDANSLVAHYTFDDTDNIGADTSGHGLDLNFNGGNGVTLSSDAKAGGGAANFDGNSFLSYNSAPGVVLNALAGDFTVSFWIKTTQDNGNENGPAYEGAGIVAADVPSLVNDVVPAALDGGQIGFNTGGNADETMNSIADVNQDNSYHHVVVTRDQATGVKKIYIDGALDNTEFAAANLLLNAPVLVAVGCAIDASQSDPNNADPHQYFEGLLDDLQIYSRVLTPAEISFLSLNPGATIKPSIGGHKNVAHYTFDDGNNLGQDSSGNGNDMPGITYWGPREQADSDAVAGGGSLRLFGTSTLDASDQTISNLDAVLAGSFSFSAWIKTTVTNGSDGNNAFFGGVIFWAYNDHNNTNDTIPLSITGNRAAFTTRGTNSGQSETLHSLPGVNDGTYHLLTVTRDESTGEKKMYVDGNLQASEISTTEPLNGNDYYMSIGGRAYILNQTSTVTNYSSYSGLLDDLQIYSGVLSADEAMYLYQHPGSAVADVSGEDYNATLNTIGLSWSSGGDLPWFSESAITHDGVSAAESGHIAESQSSYLSTIVTENGQVSFYWKVSSEQDFDFLHFYINGVEKDSISGEVDWAQKTYPVSAGDVLRWEYTKDDSNSDGLDSGFLDEVSFSPVLTVITVNPFDQTNSPGYSVALLAGATGNPNPSFQWYKLGVGAIAGATNTLYIPTNSGTAAVAGSYYAIASNVVNSAITTTAAVTFVSAPLPPDWAKAFKSPFQAQDASLVYQDFYLGLVFDGSASNNIYTATEFGGNVTFGAVQLSSGANEAAAVVKQTTNGAPLWIGVITNNGLGFSSGRSIASAPGGGAYLAGNISGTNYINGTLLQTIGGLDMFLARYDASGANLWTKIIGGTNDDFNIFNGVTSDSSGNVTLIGLLGTGPFTLGSSNYNIVNQEGIIAQFDQNGALLWSQILPGEFPQHITCSSGRIYLAMNSTGGNIIYGGTTNATDRSWALLCLNANDGHALWAHGVGASNTNNQPNPYSSGVIDDVPRIAVSGADVFVTGVAYDSSAAFGAVTVNFPLPRGQYLARYDTNGNAQLAITYGSVTTTPFGIVADSAGNVYIGGDFDSSAIFGSNVIAGPINRRLFGDFSQAFLAKFDRNGNALWARPAISPAMVLFRSIGLAPDGVWAAGITISTNTSSGYTPTAFGTNFVFSDTQAIVSGIGLGTVTFTGFPGGVLAKIADVAPPVALPITLSNVHNSGTNFQFSFQSQSGFTHSVQYRTNLVVGTDWQTYTNIPGDGSLQTIPVPYAVFSPSKVGFIRVKTQ